MDDELEDRILYQTYLSHVKLMSKFAVGTLPTAGITASINHLWHILGTYCFKPELMVTCLIIILVFIYVRLIDPWSQTALQKIQSSLKQATSKISKFQFLVNNASSKKADWELLKDNVAVYALQGHRAHMEDRFVINKDITDSGVSLFAVFDGHGGQFAANYARDKLVPNIVQTIVELKNLTSGKIPENARKFENSNEKKDLGKDIKTSTKVELAKKKSLCKTMATKMSLTDDCTIVGITDPEILSKIDSISKTITRQVKPNLKKSEAKNMTKVDATSYLNGNEINYSKLLTDQILSADKLLVEIAKKNMDVAGTTALIAIIEGNKLIVANVGDSRGVMCDGKGNAIPLSFDHKPQQQRERNRIYKAGGVVTFNGVWRVAGILATSRALGDYPLKDKKLVVADPDILTFDLDDHNPMFILLASDGLWDTFSNEEAVAFVKERIDEPHFGAKSLALSSYSGGSLDNITVVVINMKNSKSSTHV
ncbi:protein phosphatase 1L [Copidosoma floridanum]|uniref:protein phosphatase 1L n=1 Tax=Copidosoma floridanum TaxID=29053 RepID=UPI0006C9CD9B|nr:protein phosphatase 1L [Copidosoma floridanum]XP_014217467.1 protein phosphatase 1L [Copidosoma floridanum]